MIKTFLLVTVDTRIEKAKELIESKKHLKDADEWEFLIVAQNYKQSDIEAMDKFLSEHEPTAKIVYVDSLIGPHSARIVGLRSKVSDIWVNLDDDMAFCEKTDYRPIVRRLLSDKSVGFVSGNWGRTLGLALKKEAKDEFVKQNIIYTGGGLCYRKDVAYFMAYDVPDMPYLFDDIEWAMQAYIRGYDNYRYLGSVTVHSVCTNGGRRNWVRLGAKHPNDSKYITLRKAKPFYEQEENNYYIPLSKDLTDFAHKLHKENRKAGQNGC